MILITGGSGKTGRAILQALVNRAQSVRVMTRNTALVPSLREGGATEVIVGDMRDLPTMLNAAAGCDAIYHICPNMHLDEVTIGGNVIRAAQDARVERIVYHSVLHPQAQEMPHHWNKLRVEKMLMTSGVRFTVLQPTAYYQNLLANWSAIQQEGVLRLPYAADTRISLVDLDDVALIAAKVLCEAGHDNAIYELAGTHGLRQSEVAATFADVLGRSVHMESQPREEWAQLARTRGMSDYAIETLLKMFEYYERFGMCGNPNVLTALLWREPTSLRAFIQRQFAAPDNDIIEGNSS